MLILIAVRHVVPATWLLGVPAATHHRRRMHAGDVMPGSATATHYPSSHACRRPDARPRCCRCSGGWGRGSRRRRGAALEDSGARAGGDAIALSARRGGGHDSWAGRQGSRGVSGPARRLRVFARADGSNVLALAAAPRGRALLLQASVVGPQGEGVAGLDVLLALDRRSAKAAACGAGCYKAQLPGNVGRPSVAVVTVQKTRWRVALPHNWPPADGGALMARAGRVWRSLRSLSYRERLASDSSHAVTSVWHAATPDRIAYTVTKGYSSVIIGGRRWDRAPGGRWVASAQTSPIHQPVPFWVSVKDAHVLGSEQLRGHAVWRVSFFDPATPAWFEVATRQADAAHARALDVRDCALHARRVQRLRRAGGNPPARLGEPRPSQPGGARTTCGERCLSSPGPHGRGRCRGT